MTDTAARLSAALEAMTDAVFISDAEGNFVQFNEAFTTFHRFKSKQETLKALADYPAILEVSFADGQVAPLDMWAVPRALRGETASDQEYRLQRKDTGETWIGSYSFAPIRDAQGAIVGSVIIGRDVTEQKRSQDELDRARQILEAQIQNSPLAVVEFDSSFHVIRWSREAERVFGYQADEILGKAITEMRWVFEDDIALVEAESAGLVDGSRRRSKNVNRNYRKDGSVIWCEWYSSAIYDEDGQLASVFSLVLDITKRKRNEDALHDSLDRATRLAQREATLKQIADVASASLEPEELGTRISETVARLFRAKQAQIRLLSEDGAILRFGGAYDPDGFLRQVGDMPLDAPTETAAAFRTGKPRIGEDILASVPEASRENAKRAGIRSYVLIPVKAGERAIGVFYMAWAEPRTFSDDDLSFMNAVAAQCSVGLQNARLFDAEQRASRANRVLSDISVLLGSTLLVEESLSLVLAQAGEFIGANGAAIVLPEGEGWCVDSAWGLYEGLAGRRFSQQELPFPSTVLKDHEALYEPDISRATWTDRDLTGDGGSRAFAIYPMTVRGAILGVLAFGFPRSGTFDELIRTFMSRVAYVVSASIENERLYEIEHSIAETLQQTLVVLPAGVPGITFSRAYESATSEVGRVGGDFVDVFEIRDHVVGLVIGDVSGKGMEAAVITSLVRNTVRAHAVDGLPPGEVCAKTNNVMRRFSAVEAFVTMFFGVLDTRTGLLRYVSAGHPAALVVGGTATEELSGKNPVLGAFDDATFHESQAVVCERERLVLYTDGVTEARSPGDGRFLEIDGVKRILDRHAEAKTLELAKVTMEEVIGYSDGVLRDDAAILVVEPTDLTAAAGA